MHKVLPPVVRNALNFASHGKKMLKILTQPSPFGIANTASLWKQFHWIIFTVFIITMKMKRSTSIQMGFDAFFFARTHYLDKAARLANKSIEFNWHTSDDLSQSLHFLPFCEKIGRFQCCRYKSSYGLVLFGHVHCATEYMLRSAVLWRTSHRRPQYGRLQCRHCGQEVLRLCHGAGSFLYSFIKTTKDLTFVSRHMFNELTLFQQNFF